MRSGQLGKLGHGMGREIYKFSYRRLHPWDLRLMGRAGYRYEVPRSSSFPESFVVANSFQSTAARAIMLQGLIFISNHPECFAIRRRVLRRGVLGKQQRGKFSNYLAKLRNTWLFFFLPSASAADRVRRIVDLCSQFRWTGEREQRETAVPTRRYEGMDLDLKGGITWKEGVEGSEGCILLLASPGGRPSIACHTALYELISSYGLRTTRMHSAAAAGSRALLFCVSNISRKSERKGGSIFGLRDVNKTGPSPFAAFCRSPHRCWRVQDVPGRSNHFI
ncbi:hypothetical protein ALC60_03170 [Trachymyrmex zeteki]|uniref:Uncharacterized protein n=1 Tax=Mycetomoellerius zeteki TaxID=64791 RepID=A0A151XBZ4_9HYME|nr:hypothetical protein ALC60_03170 [Trachymyrmex zeteki]